MNLAAVLEFIYRSVIVLDVVDPFDGSHSVALGPHGGEVHLLIYEIALLPGHGAAVFLPGPNLVSVLVDVPVCDAVILGDLLALGQLLLVLQVVSLLLAVLVLEVLVGGLTLLNVVLGPHGHAALSPSNGFTLEFSGLKADFLVFLLTFPVSFNLAAPLISRLVLDNIPEGDVAAEISLNGSFGQAGERDEDTEEREHFEESHDETVDLVEGTAGEYPH